MGRSEMSLSAIEQRRRWKPLRVHPSTIQYAEDKHTLNTSMSLCHCIHY